MSVAGDHAKLSCFLRLDVNAAELQARFIWGSGEEGFFHHLPESFCGKGCRCWGGSSCLLRRDNSRKFFWIKTGQPKTRFAAAYIKPSVSTSAKGDSFWWKFPDDLIEFPSVGGHGAVLLYR